MKAIIPVAGAGTRLRPHTYTQPKPLIPVAGKPIIAFIIESLQNAGIQDFVFVIGYLGEKIKSYIEENHTDINVEFVVQEHREGLGHAVWTAKEKFEKEDEILIVLGDIIFDTDLQLFLQAQNSCIGVKKVNEPRRQTDTQIGTQTDRHIDRQTNTHRQTHTHTDRHTHTQTDTHTDTQTDTQTHTDR